MWSHIRCTDYIAITLIAKKNLKKSTSQQRAPAAKGANSLLGCVRSVSSRLMEVIIPLSTGEATPRVMGPVLGFPVQERHGYNGESPVKGLKDDHGAGASVL